MRSQKRFTNTTFTKRVDHDGGRHRTQRAAAEPLICESCGAVYVNRRWTLGENAVEAARHEEQKPIEKTICPACKQVRHGVPGGFVHLEGAFLATHRDEIDGLLRNEVARAEEDNPLARIMQWEEMGENRLKLSTTTEHLAQRLGHALEKAFSGEVRYDFSHENKLARVFWRRD